MSYTFVTITTAATATIVTANEKRISLIITNIGAGSAFIGEDSSVTSANGIKLVSNGTYTEDGGSKGMYVGPLFARAGSVGTTLTYWQRI